MNQEIIGNNQEERDKYWLENVYQGDTVPQLTLRSVITGMLLGGLMSLSNLYVGFKTGWGLGVSITSCIMAFAIFKTLQKLFPVFFKSEFTILENNTMQSAATAAAYISSAGLVSAIPAMMMLTGHTLSGWKLTLWIAAICYLGLIMAIPMKRQMINHENLKFPSGVATAETLKSMHIKGIEAMKKARALGIAGFLGVIITWWRDGVMGLPLIKAGHFVRAGGVVQWKRFLPAIPATIIPSRWMIGGFPLSRLTLSFEGSLIMVGAGAIMGIRIGISLLIGAVLDYGILAPMMIQKGYIRHPAPAISYEPHFPLTVKNGSTVTFLLKDHDIEKTLIINFPSTLTFNNDSELVSYFNSDTLPDGSKNPLAEKEVMRVNGKMKPVPVIKFEAKDGKISVEASRAVQWDAELTAVDAEAIGIEKGKSKSAAYGGYRNIVAWAMWPGVAVMVTSGLLSFFFQWKTILRAFSGLAFIFGKKKTAGEKDPMEEIEVPGSWFISGFIITALACVSLQWFFFGISVWMAILAVLMTFFLSVVACRATGETDITPIGAMGKITQLLYGVIAPGNMITNLMTANVTAGGATASADLLTDLKSGYVIGGNPRKQFIAQLFGIATGSLLCVYVYRILIPNADVLGTDKLPAPAAQVWAGVARLLSQGLSALPPYAVTALIIGGLIGIIITILEKLFPKARKFMPSPSGLGIAFVVPGFNSVSMFLGALIAWIVEKKWKATGDRYTLPVASGLIAGESLMGIFIAFLIVLNLIS